MTEDYLRYYDLETYLFEDVHKRFHEKQRLDAFDLFSIIIWKAERAKSKLAHRLIKQADNLEAAADQLTHALFEAKSPKDRLFVAMETWGFYLPMASAILSVLWPEEFTVYDVRACGELGDFSKLGNLTFEHLWPKYCAYCDAVRAAVPQHDALRDKDRFLWGNSTARQLKEEISKGFSEATTEA
ncbi:MAG TPA: hypothetical protein VKH40_16285 [Alloacidobacterium sp.]|nr:hypothetical protein [Alloacidobacterium sp.]